MQTQFPCFEHDYPYATFYSSYPCDRQFMRRCFAHWEQELTAKQKRCKNRIVGWAVLEYAKEIWGDLDRDVKTGEPVNMKTLLNGARGWDEYSNGGCSLIYHCDIKERLGKYYPSERSGISDLEVQARFLRCAAPRILKALAYNKDKNQCKFK